MKIFGTIKNMNEVFPILATAIKDNLEDCDERITVDCTEVQQPPTSVSLASSFRFRSLVIIFGILVPVSLCFLHRQEMALQEGAGMLRMTAKGGKMLNETNDTSKDTGATTVYGFKQRHKDEGEKNAYNSKYDGYQKNYSSNSTQDVGTIGVLQKQNHESHSFEQTSSYIGSAGASAIHTSGRNESTNNDHDENYSDAIIGSTTKDQEKAFKGSVPDTTAHIVTETKLVDFAIIGFPKCGTTFLRNTLLQVSQEDSADATSFNSKEGNKGSEMNKQTKYQFFYGNEKTEIHLLRQNNVDGFMNLFQNTTRMNNNHIAAEKEIDYKKVENGGDHDNDLIKIIRKGFKCPDILYSRMALANMETYLPTTDLVVSVRHPIRWFESFYNYRVRKGYAMPYPNDLIGSCGRVEGEEVHHDNIILDSRSKPAKGRNGAHKVCTDNANFHIGLSLLGKTSMESVEELQLLHYNQSRHEHDQDGERSLSRDDVGNGRQGHGHEDKTEVMASNTLTTNQEMEKSVEKGTDNHPHLHPHRYQFNNRIFLMELGQLSIENRMRADQFVDDLESFLGLGNANDGSRFRAQLQNNTDKHDVDNNSSFGKHYRGNQNHDGTDIVHLPKLKHHRSPHRVKENTKIEDVKENIIDICSSEYDNLRSTLLTIGRDASLWIELYFMKSSDVFVSNKKHFRHLLHSWQNDPCDDHT